MRTKPTIPEATALARAIYARPGGEVGCCLHIILDDENCEDDDVVVCVATAFLTGHADCIHLAGMLAAMSESDREAVSRGVRR